MANEELQTPTHESLDLEEILKKAASMGEDFGVAEIMPRIIDSFHEHTKYTTEDGVVRYKTDFSETSDEDIEKIADSIFDSLVYHAHHLHHTGISLDKFEELKGIKDKNGNSYVDTVTQSLFGLNRTAIKRMLTRNKKNLTDDFIASIMERSMSQYIKGISDDIFSDIQDHHLDYVKEFVDYKKKVHNLPKDKHDIGEHRRADDELYSSLSKLAREIYSSD